MIRSSGRMTSSTSVASRNRRARQGFSLLEIIVAVSIVALFLFMGIRLTDREFSGSQSLAAANKVRDTLNLTKSLARAWGEPVGLALRTRGGYASQSLYLISGTQSLRVWQAEDWGNEFPAAWASWGRTASDSVQEVATNGDFNLTEIDNVPTQDPFILFLPSGEFLTRGLPFDGTEYRIRVGVNPQGSGSSTPSSATLSGMDKVWAVGIQPSGSISLDRETTLPPGSTTTLTRVEAEPLSTAVTQVPTVRSLTTFPTLTEVSPGVYSDASQEPVILNAVAESPAGVQLFARWECDGGQFSLEDEWVPMTFSKADRVWKCSSSWKVPPNPTSSYNVSLKVRDKYGNLALDSSNSSLEILVPAEDFQVYFTYDEDTFDAARTKTYEVINSDGSGRQVLMTVPHFHNFYGSPDSQLIAMQSNDVSNGLEIYFTARDGTILNTTTVPRKSFIKSWASDNSAVFTHTNNSATQPVIVYKVKADGSPAEVLASLPPSTHLFNISGDGRYILFAARPATGDQELTILDRNDNSQRVLYTDPNLWKGSFSPDQEYIAFAASNRLHRMRLDGTDDRDFGPGFKILFSPDGNRMATVNGSISGATFKVLDIDGNLIWEKPGHQSGYNSTAWSPDGKTIITCKENGEEGGIMLIDENGNERILVEETSTASFHSWENFNGLTAE